MTPLDISPFSALPAVIRLPELEPAVPCGYNIIEPILYNELSRRRQSLSAETEKLKIDSWKTLENQDPKAAHYWLDLFRKHKASVKRIYGPSQHEQPLKAVAHELYNELISYTCNLHTHALFGNLESIFELGEYYRTGNGVPTDPYLAFRLIRYAAEQGYDRAFSALGKYYGFGIGTQQNLHEAVHWLLKTDKKDKEILALLAYCYHTGTGVPEDKTKAYDLWLDAAVQGHREGFHYCQIAADAGYARGQYTLGHFYQNGIGTPPDILSALHWSHKAAEQGYAHAQYRLGVLYHTGNYGIERSPETAVQWYKLAADQNDFYARSQLADCLVFGSGIEQNIGDAIRILRELIQPSPGYPRGDPTSQYRLGALLTSRESGVYNPAEGVKLLRRSAEQHTALAQTALGTH